LNTDEPKRRYQFKDFVDVTCSRSLYHVGSN